MMDFHSSLGCFFKIIKTIQSGSTLREVNCSVYPEKKSRYIKLVHILKTLGYIGDEILPRYVRDYNKIGKSYDFYHLFRLKSWGKTSTNQPTNQPWARPREDAVQTCQKLWIKVLCFGRQPDAMDFLATRNPSEPTHQLRVVGSLKNQYQGFSTIQTMVGNWDFWSIIPYGLRDFNFRVPVYAPHDSLQT